MSLTGAGIFVFFLMFTISSCDERRPVYIIGHMVNSIRQVKKYLDMGANVIESDIQFHSNGSVKEVYHGVPCDCFRTCTRSAILKNFLQYVRQITDPSHPGNYKERMIMQFFDLKLSTSNNKKVSGREIARHVLEYLWTQDGSRQQEIRALIYIDSVNDYKAIQGFIEEFQSRGVESRLRDVGFDGGMGDLREIRRMFARLGVEGNIWQGDGGTNCFSLLAPVGRLRREVGIRDSESGFIQKVYHWTIDQKLRMRWSLDIGVDAMITNDPYDLVDVLEESYYRNYFRLATPADNPFIRFEG